MSQIPTAGMIAAKLNGEIVGDPNTPVTGINSLKDANPGDLSFLGNQRYEDQLAATAATTVLVPRKKTGEPKEGQTWIKCDDPNIAFSFAGEIFAPPSPTYPVGVHPTAFVAPDAVIGENVSIGPNCVVQAGAKIGNGTTLVAQCYVGHDAVIGDNCVIYPLVMIRERCILGNRVILQSGVIIGGDGFGFAPTPKGIIKIPQFGIVQIDDDVEIGANTTVDRARFGKTWIKAQTKIDNLVMVAHNVVVGERCFLVGQAGIAGSTTLGNEVILAAKAGVNGHIELGDRTQLAGMSGLTKSCPPDSVMIGLPAERQNEFAVRFTLPRAMDKLQKRLKDLEAKLKELEGK